jgi:hypothetical protein
MTPYYLHSPVSLSGQSRHSKSRGRSRGQSKGKAFGALWGDSNSELFDQESNPSVLTVLAREQRIRAMHINDQLQLAMKQYERLAEQNEKDQHDKLLLAKVVNTLFHGKNYQPIHMEDIFALNNPKVDLAAAAVAAAANQNGAHYETTQFLHRENSDVGHNDVPMFRNNSHVAHHSGDANSLWNVPQSGDHPEEKHQHVKRLSLLDAATHVMALQQAVAAAQDEKGNERIE